MVAAAVAAVGLGSAALHAAPLVTVKVEGRATDADPWSSALNPSAGAVLQYRVVVDTAAVGTANNSGTARTINTLVNAKDGINALQFNLLGIEGANVAFTGPGTVQGSWTGISGAGGGTANGGTLTGIKVGQAPGVFAGIDPETVLVGNVTVNGSGGKINGVWASNYNGSMHINADPNTGAGGQAVFLNNANVNHAPAAGTPDPILQFIGLAIGDVPPPSGAVTIVGGTPGANGASTLTVNLGNLLDGGNVGRQFSLQNGASTPADVTVTSNNAALTTNWTNPTSVAGNATVVSNMALNTATAPLGAFTGTLTVDNTTNNTSDDNDIITVTANVGLATAADSGAQNRSAFVPANALTAPVAANGSYAGLSSQTTRGGNVLGTKAEILSGTNTGAATTVSMNWRTRAADETPGTATNPPINLAVTKGLIADVVDLNGIATGQVYVMQMSYDDTLFAAGEEARAAAAGQLYLVALNEINGRDTAAGPADDLWVNAVDLNNNGTGSGANKQLTVGAWNNDLTVGHYGVDTTNNVVWAVMNRDLQFSVVPEPATFGLLGLAAAAFGFGRRRRA